jgi:hypothetical protein
MERIKQWWSGLSDRLLPGALRRVETADMTARELCRMMIRCPVCGGEFEDHAYAHFAVTVLADEPKERVRDFIEACEDQRWEDAQRFQDFDRQNDAIVAYVMRCNTGRLSILLERSPFEVYESDRLFSCNVLNEISGRRLERLVSSNDWRRLHWT